MFGPGTPTEGLCDLSLCKLTRLFIYCIYHLRFTVYTLAMRRLENNQVLVNLQDLPNDSFPLRQLGERKECQLLSH